MAVIWDNGMRRGIGSVVNELNEEIPSDCIKDAASAAADDDDADEEEDEVDVEEEESLIMRML